MTDDELDVIASALLLRAAETGTALWASYHDEFLVECHRLVDRGYLERMVRDGDLLYRASDAAVVAQAMSDLTADPSAN